MQDSVSVEVAWKKWQRRAADRETGGKRVQMGFFFKAEATVSSDCGCRSETGSEEDER